VPSELIDAVSESLLAHYAGKPLVSHYDVYQHLMDYWAATMQDDGYMIASDGWKAETTRIVEKDKNGKARDKGWACDLVPKALIVARYFAGEQDAIDALVSEQERVTAELAELEEEHGGEEGAFAELDKVNKANVARALKENGTDGTKGTDGDDGTADVLRQWLALNEREGQLKREVKEAEANLDALAYGKYPELTEGEIKALVVDDKWLATLQAAVQGEVDRISQRLAQRVRDLAERYADPLPTLSARAAELEAKVAGHLGKMGFKV